MKNYELTVVLHPDLEMNVDPAIDKIKKILESVGGNIIKEDNEGKKRLSYTIKGHDFGIYSFITVALPPEAPAKIDGILNITDEVLRHMLVKEDVLRTKHAANQQVEDSEPEESESETELNEEKGE